MKKNGVRSELSPGTEAAGLLVKGNSGAKMKYACYQVLDVHVYVDM